MLSIFISLLYLSEDICEIKKCCMKFFDSDSGDDHCLGCFRNNLDLLLMCRHNVQSLRCPFRSASYRAATGECRLSDMDRHTVAGTGAFQESVGDEYLENNCADDPVKLCDFQLLENRIMKTVDSVYQVSFLIKSH